MVHFGRVSSWEHVEAAANRGANSADGTFLTFGPDKNLPKAEYWFDCVNGQISLWEVAS